MKFETKSIALIALEGGKAAAQKCIEYAQKAGGNDDYYNIGYFEAEIKTINEAIEAIKAEELRYGDGQA